MVDDVPTLVALSREQSVELCEIIPGDDLDCFDLAADITFSYAASNGLPTEGMAPPAFYAPSEVSALMERGTRALSIMSRRGDGSFF